MKTAPARLHLLGLNVQGDLGPITTYRSQRKRIISFPRVSPLNPASELQRLNREKFAAAARAWQQLTPEKRANWELASKRASIGITGYNLWTFYQIHNDRNAIQTIERQTRISLIP